MTIYYVDATNGNDDAAGTSELTPWETVTKVNSSSFNAGDSILFKRAETWYIIASNVIDQGGNAGADVTYGAYGTGDDPIISAARLVTGWANTVGEEYKADLAESQGAIDPRSVWQGTTQLVLGSEGSLARGEYYYDAAADELHVRTTTGVDPSGFTIEAANIRNCIYVQVSYVTIENIVLEKGNTYNLQLASRTPILTDITVENVASNRGAWHGMLIGDTGDNTPNNVTIDTCTIYMWNRAGTTTEDAIMVTEGDGGGGNNLIIRDCTIEGDIPYGVDTSYGRNGISVAGGDNALIEHNDITGCDHGIKLQDSITAWTVRWNFIHEIGDDGFELSDLDSADGLIYGNILYKVSDNFFGINSDVVGADLGGIYNNSCYQSLNHGIAITLKADATVAIKNNIFGTLGDPFYIIYDTQGPTDVSNLDIDYNTYYDYSRDGTASFAYIQYGALIKTFTEWKASYSQDANSEVADPKYADPGDTPASASDYTILAGSPCTNTGVDVGLTEDYLGNSIPVGSAPDIGAYEMYLSPVPLTLLSRSTALTLEARSTALTLEYR